MSGRKTSRLNGAVFRGLIISEVVLEIDKFVLAHCLPVLARFFVG